MPTGILPGLNAPNLPSVPGQITMKMPPLDPNSPPFEPQGATGTNQQSGNRAQSKSTSTSHTTSRRMTREVRNRRRLAVNVRQDIHPTPTYTDRPKSETRYFILNSVGTNFQFIHLVQDKLKEISICILNLLSDNFNAF